MSESGKLKNATASEVEIDSHKEEHAEHEVEQRKGADGGEDKKDSDKDKADENDEKEEKKPKGAPVYKKPAFIITVSVVLIALIVGGIIFWLIARQYVSTDDAYVDGHVVQISTQVAAPVLELRVDDNQFVHRGDLLLRLDPKDYDVALQQAEAQVATAEARLAQAKAQVISANAAVPEAVAQQNSAQASFDNATRDAKRYEQVDKGARSKQQLDAAQTAEANNRAQLDQAKARVESANASVKTAEAAVKAAVGDLKVTEASRKKAEVNLSYCSIYSPINGRVTQRTVEAGNYVSPGQALFLLVDPNIWVTANFKETQLAHLRPGQRATIRVDAFPGQKFEGTVDSVQAGSGSRFSVLPAENATGNYVKIVQRVPVKILFQHDANTNNAPMLSPGLSVIPRVKVR